MASSRTAHIKVRESDLSTSARIRNAALEEFAEKGVSGTTLRGVAAAAGVSTGLVQHHFGTKAGLKQSVEQHVVDVALETFGGLVGDTSDADIWSTMGDKVTAWVAENTTSLRYLARALTDGDPSANRVFTALLMIARSQWLEPLARGGGLDPKADADWAALHVTVFNLATVLLEPAISAQLPEPLFTPSQLRRWNVATTELYRRGFAMPRRRSTTRT